MCLKYKCEIDIGGDEWDSIEGVEILDVVILSLDKLDLKAILLTNYGQKNYEIEIVRV